MPWLEKRGGTYRVKFRFGGKVRQAALKTGDETAATTALAKFKETLSDVLRGRLKIPDGTDVGLFLLTDGKLEQKPVHVDAPPAITLGELFAHYQADLTPARSGRQAPARVDASELRRVGANGPERARAVLEAVEAAATRRKYAGAEFRPAATAAKARCHTRALLSLDQSAKVAGARCR